MGWPRWTVAGDKSARDWLPLLIVPTILIGVALTWSYRQTTSENKREGNRLTADRAAADRRIREDRTAAETAREDTLLGDYLRQMNALMLERKLGSSAGNDPVRAVARTVTLTALRRLDGERKGEVVRFLHEAELITVEEPRVGLASANLTGADLAGADLSGANLARANLAGANLAGARLSGAELSDARLLDADLSGANLAGADLSRADLSDSDLSYADISGADLLGANLLGSALSWVFISAEQLKQTKYVPPP